MTNEKELRNYYYLRRWKNDQFIGKWDVANLQMQYVSIRMNPKISYAFDNSDNVNGVEVESIGWEALNWMKMDEILHPSGGPKRIWCTMTFVVASTCDTWLFSHECHGWVAGKLGFPKFGDPNNMWAPKQVRSHWDLSSPKGLFVWVKPQVRDDLKNKGPRMRW
jgi:hypothetical protein